MKKYPGDPGAGRARTAPPEGKETGENVPVYENLEAMKEAVQLLQDAGFTRQDAIELLKVQAISNTCEVLDSIRINLDELQSMVDSCTTGTAQGAAVRITGDIVNYEG